MNKLILLVCCFLVGCTENDLATTAVVAGAGYGLYRVHKISQKTEGSTYSPIYYSEDDYSEDDCKKYYQVFPGCCSGGHGGVAGCYDFHVICNDGTRSRSCECNIFYCRAY